MRCDRLPWREQKALCDRARRVVGARHPSGFVQNAKVVAFGVVCTVCLPASALSIYDTWTPDSAPTTQLELAL